MRILTLNHHESYINSLASTGHQFDVITRIHDIDLSWNISARPKPENINLVPFDETIKRRLETGYYDTVICHTIKNLIWFWRYNKINFIFVAHIPLFFNSLPLALKSLFKKLTYIGFRLTHKCHFLAVSQFKYEKWWEKGDIVILAPESFPKLKKDAELMPITVVCNKLMDRKQELGYDYIKQISQQYDVQVIGDNPGCPFAVRPRDFQDFVQKILKSKIYLYTIQYPHGDGYNTAMLEAMAMGKCIVSLPNPSSPIIHRKNGLIANNYEELIACIEELKSRPDLADELGRNAQKTIQVKFAKSVFLENWNQILHKVSEIKRAGMPPSEEDCPQEN